MTVYLIEEWGEISESFCPILITANKELADKYAEDVNYTVTKWEVE